MDMRKLIDDTDFDNLNELSKKWKKQSQVPSKSEPDLDGNSSRCRSDLSQEPPSPPLKQNIHQQYSQVQPNSQTQQDFKRKREVLPQIIDEDTEVFRNRLEHLLNGFKTDAVSEFMSMKKSMLEYQRETIKNDTQNYLTMYEEKHKQLLSAKDQLITLTSELQRKTMQIELMSAHVAKLNLKVKTNQYLTRPFALLLQNKLEQQSLKIKNKIAEKHDIRSTKMKGFNGWRNLYRESKEQRNEEINSQKVEIQVKEIAAKYQKEIETLKEKLNEANRKNQQYENSKHIIQDNLKKAFLRGISSMNMEAMGIFGANEDRNEQESMPPEKNSNFDYSMRSFKSEQPEPISQQPQINPSVIVNRSKVESKDHKWKEAPIMGFTQKEEAQQPRPQMVKPTTEAKVIRVVDGKSSVESTQKPKRSGVSSSEALGGNKLEGSKRRN